MQPSRRRRFATLAAVAVAAVMGAAPAGARSGPGAFTTRGAWNFVSAPAMHPPKLLVNGVVSRRELARGDFLLANFPNLAASGLMTGQGGPLLVDRNLQPVWFAPVRTTDVAGDLQQETYQGAPVLAWWQGQITHTGATSRGQLVVVDAHYHRLATLRAKAPWVISLHDAVISGGNVWVTVYRNVRNQNLAAYGGRRKGTVYDAGVQEYDLGTGKLLYTWDALNPGHTPHVPLAASEQPASALTAPGAAWDPYHVNSIQVLPGNQILVSMRNTWAAYLIDTTTSRIVWTLGGKRAWNTFRFGPGAFFTWQHDVKLVSSDRVTLFDDACCRLDSGHRLGRPSGPSRGVILRIDFRRRTASLVKSYTHRPRLDSLFLGSMQVLPNRNALVGFGSLPYFSEYSRAGKQLLDVRFPGKDQSYRALYTSTWVGTPYYPPNAAVRRSAQRTTIYASWNGATSVSRWQVLASATKPLKALATVARSGFETTITLNATKYQSFEVRALDSRGRILGTSRVVR